MDILIDIKNYLPHRKPMLMVDMILKMDEEKVETIFEIKEDNIFVKKSTFTEAGLIENAAQACSSIVAKDVFVDENNQNKADVDSVGYISSIKVLKIHKLPKVGSRIKTIATLISKFVTNDYNLCSMRCKTFYNEDLLLEGDINIFIKKNNLK